MEQGKSPAPFANLLVQRQSTSRETSDGKSRQKNINFSSPLRNCVFIEALERLELNAGKLARSVLRGGGGGNTVSLPDQGEGGKVKKRVNDTRKTTWVWLKHHFRVFFHAEKVCTGADFSRASI